MKDKLVTKASKGISRTKRFANNVENFVQAVSMLTLVTFCFWALRQIEINNTLRYVVVTALVVIGLRGAYEFIKFLDAERK